MDRVHVLLVRPVVGTVGERRRVVHIVRVAEGHGRPSRLRACCREEFEPGDLELLDHISGMPCEDCLRHVPLYVTASQKPELCPQQTDVRADLSVVKAGERLTDLCSADRKERQP